MEGEGLHSDDEEDEELEQNSFCAHPQIIYNACQHPPHQSRSHDSHDSSRSKEEITKLCLNACRLIVRRLLDLVCILLLIAIAILLLVDGQYDVAISTLISILLYQATPPWKMD